MAPKQQQVIYRVQNDTQPNIQFVIEREPPTGSDPSVQPTIVDLTSYSAITLTIVSQATNTNTNSGHTACQIQSPATAGLVDYVLQSGDLPDDGGDYKCDLTLTDAAGSETWYSYLLIRTRARV